MKKTEFNIIRKSTNPKTENNSVVITGLSKNDTLAFIFFLGDSKIIHAFIRKIIWVNFRDLDPNDFKIETFSKLDTPDNIKYEQEIKIVLDKINDIHEFIDVKDEIKIKWLDD